VVSVGNITKEDAAAGTEGSEKSEGLKPNSSRSSSSEGLLRLGGIFFNI
jgi:hypothetical protein